MHNIACTIIIIIMQITNTQYILLTSPCVPYCSHQVLEEEQPIINNIIIIIMIKRYAQCHVKGLSWLLTPLETWLDMLRLPQRREKATSLTMFTMTFVHDYACVTIQEWQVSYGPLKF